MLHVEVGTEDGTDSWFHSPAAQASADFGVADDGTLHQWVDLADKAWAQAFYNRDWFSVETEGTPDEPLTTAQVATCGRLFAWLAQQDGFPLQITDDPNGQGLITHGDLGSQGGGHLGCPGALRSAQRPDILNAALGHTAPAQPVQEDDMPGKQFKLHDDTIVIFPANGEKPWAVPGAAGTVGLQALIDAKVVEPGAWPVPDVGQSAAILALTK